MTRERTELTDTSPEAGRKLAEIHARMTPGDRLARVNTITEAVCRLSLAGLGLRHPGAPREELLLRLTRLRLGDELTDLAYGRAGSRGT